MTVISPVYHNDKVIFYVGNRGHHSDIGGLTPGSMPPFSKNLEEEGAAIYSFKLVQNEVFQEEKIKYIFNESLIEKGVNPSRNLKDNISDLKAQVASNYKGIELIMEMVEKFGLEKIKAYMKFIQEAAESSVQEMLDKFGEIINIPKDGQGSSYAEDYMDDGSKICLKITIDRKYKKAVFDFSGTSCQVYGNINTPRSVTYSSIIYCLRCLVNSEIPLNQGCLNPVIIIIPQNSLLWPSETCAVVGGNVTTSQRITDIILKCFKACAASQGDMNNFTFGNDSIGYYETIGGGSGAGPTWHGKSGVQVHMTNTRITDVEIIERRYPVLIENFGLRRGTGGRGKYNGGDGIIRTFRFLSPLKVSILSERRVYPPFGLEGGEDGAKGINLYIRKDNIIFNIGSKNSINVEIGDSIVIMTPGGGGYGSYDESGKMAEDENKNKNIGFHSYGSLSKYFSDQFQI
jgi:5-oxoprolinase (ATP-hydrolysing)